jgi:hypothetical protein
VTTVSNPHDISRLEGDLCLPATSNSNETVHLTPNAQPFLASLHDRISRATSAMVKAQDVLTIHASAYWSKDTVGENSIVMLASEYERDMACITRIN